MGKVLLDTDILSDYLKGHHQAVVNHAARYAQQYGVFTFTSVTVYEIVYGLELKAAAAQLVRAIETPSSVRLEFSGDIRVELSRAEWEKQKHTKEWAVWFPQDALRVL